MPIKIITFEETTLFTISFNLCQKIGEALFITQQNYFTLSVIAISRKCSSSEMFNSLRWWQLVFMILPLNCEHGEVFLYLVSEVTAFQTKTFGLID